MIDLNLRQQALETTGCYLFHKVNSSMTHVWQLRSSAGLPLTDPDYNWQFSEGEAWDAAPAVEHDPAASEPWFLEWCEKNGWFFTLTNSSLNGPFAVTMYTHEDNSHFQVTGATPSEVRCRAVIAARKEKG